MRQPREGAADQGADPWSRQTLRPPETKEPCHARQQLEDRVLVTLATFATAASTLAGVLNAI
jgi:hypothetical protein